MKKNNQVLIGFFFTFFLGGCEDTITNDEALPEFGRISGAIIFNGDWPIPDSN